MFEFIETIQLKGQLKREQLKADLAQMRLLERTFNEAQKYADPDPDEGDWIKTFDGSVQGNFADGAEMYDHYEMLKKVYSFWVTDLHARAIVRNLTKFVLGKGPIIKPKSGNSVVLAAWDTFVRENKWGHREKEIVRRVFRDGEVFLRFFSNKLTAGVKVRFLRANYIRNPNTEGKIQKGESTSMGIATDPDDIEDVKAYYLCNPDESFRERIDAGEILHIKILSDSDVKRGMSILLVAMKMLKKYGGWMDDRIVLNKVRSAVALIRHVPGTASTVSNIRDKNKSSLQSEDRNKQKGLNRGTIITASKGIEYTMLSPNIQAADAKDDGRNMLLSVAAGMGFPEMILTADYSNSNYASSLTAQNPFVREIEDWQDFFEEPYKEIFRRVIQNGKELGNIPEV